MHSFKYSDPNNSRAQATFRAGQSVYRLDSPRWIQRQQRAVRAEASQSLATRTPSPGAGFRYRLSHNTSREAEARVPPGRRALRICPFATCASIRPSRSGLSKRTGRRRRSKQHYRACASNRSAMRRGQQRRERHRRRHQQLLQSQKHAGSASRAQRTQTRPEMLTAGIVASVAATLSSGSARRLRRRAGREPCQC